MLNRIDQIGTIGLRLLVYYESFINRQEPITEQYAYPSIETTSKTLGINKNTILKFNEILVTAKLLKITKHKIEFVDELDELDQPIRFTKYNNHYHVQINKL
jgi:DNA-binding transcriptional regulator YhcF (GntR family)